MELVRLASEGDRNAYWRLVGPHMRALFLRAMSIVRDFGDAEDVAQEVLLKAMRDIRGFRGEAKIKTWLVQIAVNESLMRLRKYRRHLYRPLEETADSDAYQPKSFTDRREIPSEALERKELRNALQSAIALLPLKYRQVLMLRDIAELSNKETAQVLGLTVPNVKTRLLRARLKMRVALAPRYDVSWFGGDGSGKKPKSTSTPYGQETGKKGSERPRITAIIVKNVEVHSPTEKLTVPPGQDQAASSSSISFAPAPSTASNISRSCKLA